ncbi:Calcium-dependent protein kinase 1 [Porphyridium purpureum]|uniref:Calcium-dependent protein kinase 1 n=1 Tax=Porphyridium purpureum TaxID=35688 RepID=A0A5J4YZ26_PORPP|nr:Calcium-dependent protein kinase 1 [Porphyridium purpureum]|eukprot:POR9188..scf209_3
MNIKKGRNMHSDSALNLQKRVLVQNEIFLTEKLSSGGQGIVYRAMDSDSKPLAVKVITKQYSRQNPAQVSASQTMSVHREALLLKNIDHPASLKYHSFHEDDVAWYVVTELLEGDDLFEVVCTSSFTENEILSIVKQLCELLVYLHANGISHRDIKLENVVCVRKGSLRVKLIDYGLAHSAQLEGSNVVSTHPGTHVYKAPELVLRQTDMDPRPADLWALGCMMYTACCGEYAFKGASDDLLAQSIVKKDLDLSLVVFKKVTSPFKQLLKDLLVKDPSCRLTAKQALERVETILAGRVVRSSGSSGTNEKQTRSSIHPSEPQQVGHRSGQMTKALKQMGLLPA